MPYIGKSANGFGIRETFQYTATSNQTAFTSTDINSKTLSFDNGSLVDVLLNGVMLKPTTDYNTSTANTITLTSGASTSDEVMIIVYDVFSLSDAMPKTGGTFSGAVTHTGAFTSLGIDDNADAVAMTIDSSERVLIGTTNNAFGTTDADDLVVGNLTGNHGITIASNASNGYSSILFSDADNGNGRLAGYIDYGHSANEMTFGGGGVGNTIMKLLSNKDVKIQDGNLVIGTSGHGIDFSVTSTSGQGSMSSELFSNYEEGTFSPSANDYSGTVTFTTAYYTKIGRVVNFAFKMTGDGTSDNSQVNIGGFPYAVLQEHAASLSYNTGATVGELPNAMVNTAEICYFYVPSGSGFTYTMLGSGYVRVTGSYMTSN